MENINSRSPRWYTCLPLLLFYSASLGFYTSVYQIFISFKICLNMIGNYSMSFPIKNTHEFCMELIGSANNSQIEETKDLTDFIDSESSKFMILYQIVGNVPAVFTGFLLGAWSDSSGRKPPIIIALVGSTMGYFILLITSAIEWIPIYFILIAMFIIGSTGQVLVIYTGAFAMLSDTVRDPAKLTVKIGFASGVISLGILIGSLVSGLILSYWDDYSYVFTASMISVAIAFLYMVLGADETLQYVKSVKSEWINDEEGNGNQPMDSEQHREVEFLDDAYASENNSAGNSNRGTEKTRLKRFCEAYCKCEKFRASMLTIFKKRQGRRRLYLLVSLVCFLFAFSCDVGMPGIMNLYVKRPPLSFTDSQFSYLMSCATGCAFLGTAFLPYIAKSTVHARDTVLIVSGLFLGVAKMLTTAFSKEAWSIYLASAVGGLSAVYFPGFRSFMTKLVDRSESGRLFAAVTASEQIGPLASALVFNNIFAITLHWFAGFVYVVSAATFGVVMLVMSWIHVDSGRKYIDVEVEENLENPNEDQQQLVQ